MFLTSTFRLTFFDRALRVQCSVKKSQSKCGSREHLKILPYNIMTLPDIPITLNHIHNGRAAVLYSFKSLVVISYFPQKIN